MAASIPPSSNYSLSAGETFADYDDNEVGLYAEQITCIAAFPMVMQVAIELDLFEIIAREERSSRQISAAEIVDQLPASYKKEAATKVDRILHLLAAFSVVRCSVDGSGRRVYGLAPAGRYFVRDEDGVSFGPMLGLYLDKVFMNSWSKIKESILEGGIPFNKAHGMHAFEYPRSDSRFNHVFNLGMFNHTTVLMKKVLEHYKGFENLKQLVDVGGGLGYALKIIISKYPSLKGIKFDLPHVIEQARSIPGVEHVGGDMFESIPSPAEAIFMKWILHDWSDDQCVKLLKSCYDALPNDGKVIIIECVIEDEVETSTPAKVHYLMDVTMMTVSPGGRERSRKEFIALANAAAFTTVKFECCVCNYWVVEFCK